MARWLSGCQRPACWGLLLPVFILACAAVTVAGHGALDADVIVIGLGPVGSFVTNLLASYGVERIRAFERGTAVYHAPRAVAWDDYTLRTGHMVSDELDAWMRWHVLIFSEQWDAKCKGLRSGPAASRWYVYCDYPSLQQNWRDAVMATSRPPGVTFHQPAWERKLGQLLAENQHIQAEYGTEVLHVSTADDACEVVVRRAHSQIPAGAGDSEPSNATYRARYCVAADGGSSGTRKQLGLSYEGKTFPDQPWVVVDTEVRDEEYLREAWFGKEASGFIMNPTCPFVFIPTASFFEDWWAAADAEARGGDADGSFAARRDAALFRRAAPYMRPSPLRPGSRGGLPEGPHPVRAATMYPPGTAFRFEFLLEPGTTEAEATSEAHVRRLLTECAEVDPDRLEVKRAIVYTFHARRAERWRVGPVLLAGDAAHCMPPFQGQGLNSGIRDVANLAWKLALVLRGVVEDSILDSYEPERRANLEMVTDASIKLGELVMIRSPFWAFVRDVILRGLTWVWSRSEALQRSFRGFMMDSLSIQAPGAVLATGAGQALAGAIMPCPMVLAPGTAGSPVLLDKAIPPRVFALVWCAAANASSTVPPLPLAASETSLSVLRSLGAHAVAIAPFDPNATASQPGAAVVIQGLAAGALCRDADGPWTDWVRQHSLEGSLLVVRPDRFIFGVFSSVDSAADELGRSLGWRGAKERRCSGGGSAGEPGEGVCAAGG